MAEAHPLESQDIVIDGDVVDADDFTFAESRKVRQAMAQMGVDDVHDPSLDEYLPALIWVWKQRTDPAFSIEDAQGYKLKDIMRAKANGTGPTKRARRT
jgi:hypothetical protein